MALFGSVSCIIYGLDRGGVYIMGGWACCGFEENGHYLDYGGQVEGQVAKEWA